MVTLLLLCLPLQALAYSLGGVSPTMLWGSQWMLLVTVLQVATLAIACSCWFRTTTGAFIASYVIGIVMLFGPLVLFGIYTLVFGNGRTSPGNTLVFQVLRQMGLIQSEEQMLFPFFLVAQFFITVERGGGSFWTVLFGSAPALLLSGVFLVLARWFLVPRAFAAPLNPLLEIFRGLDRGMELLNRNRLTRGRVLIKDDERFPRTEPLAWRETSKRSLGRTRYLVRMLILILLPIAFFLWLGLLNSFEACAITAICLTPVVWFVAVLLTAVSSVGLIAGERSHQTLDVLATLPVSGRQIVLQKFHGVRRLIFVLWVPLGLLVFVGALLRGIPGLVNVYGGSWRPPLIVPYLAAGLLSAIVYLPMIAWMCCLVGMVMRSQGRAIITALGLIIGWCVFPFVAIVLPLEIMFRGNVMNNFPFSWTPLLSPVTLPVVSEANEISNMFFREYRNYPGNETLRTSRGGEALLQLFLIGCNFAWYGMWWFAFRTACLQNADRFLGRIEARSALGGSTAEPAPGA
ncbi:MAG: hypothetical protein EHM42_14300, partial [Planctomycetaceae bacterium]